MNHDVSLHAELPAHGRRIRDAAAGHEWLVRECRDCVPPTRRAEGCLVFEAETAARRVWGVPADWREMPEDALVALMYPTDAVRPPAPSRAGADGVYALTERRDVTGRLTELSFIHRGVRVHAVRVVEGGSAGLWRATTRRSDRPVWLAAAMDDTPEQIAELLVRLDVTTVGAPPD